MSSQRAVTVAALRFLPSRMGCNSERDVLGDLYKRHLMVTCLHGACRFHVVLEQWILVIARLPNG